MTVDSGIGVVRHAQAGYEIAQDVANGKGKLTEESIKIPLWWKREATFGPKDIKKEEARVKFSSNLIDLDMYNLAWNEANRITSLLKEDKFELLKYSKIHKEQLEKHLHTVGDVHA